MIRVAVDGGLGYVIAFTPQDGEEHLPPSARPHMGHCLVVGSIRQEQHGDGPESWQAWLWPVAGGNVPVSQSCDMAHAGSLKDLRDLLQRRVDKNGAWWS